MTNPFAVAAWIYLETVHADGSATFALVNEDCSKAFSHYTAPTGSPDEAIEFFKIKNPRFEIKGEICDEQ